MIDKLYGDYALLIDRCFDGDQDLKAKVAFADRRGRGGLTVLLNAISNRRPTLTILDERILAQLKADQEYWVKKQQDLKNISLRKSGRYQVKVTVELNRMSATFDTLEEAQYWRDRMLALRDQINAL